MAVAFLDELASGVAPGSVAAIAREGGVPAGRLAGWLIAAFYGCGFFIEPWILRRAERVPVRRILAASLCAIAVITLAAAASRGTPWLLCALALYGPASGCALAASEGFAVESDPSRREQTLARFALAGTLGDLAVPLLLAVVHWRVAFIVGAAVAALLALGLSRRRELSRPLALSAESDAGDDRTPTLRTVLREHPQVFLWSLAECATGLMDEVMAAFLIVHAHARVSASPRDLALILGAWIVGNLAGLVLLERALAWVHPRTYLAMAAAIALLALVGVVLARDVAHASVATFALGACVCSFHPLVGARAYAALPGHPGVVGAVRSLMTPLDIVAALALGEVAMRCGSTAAMLGLGIVPALMLIVAARTSHGGAGGTRGGTSGDEHRGEN